MKFLITVLIINGALSSCKSDKNPLVNSSEKTEESFVNQKYTIPLTVEQCTQSEYLSVYFNRGCVLAIKNMRSDIIHGYYGARNVPWRDQDVSNDLSVEDYAQQLGYVTMGNQMGEDLMDGFEAYDKFLIKEGCLIKEVSP